MKPTSLSVHLLVIFALVNWAQAVQAEVDLVRLFENANPAVVVVSAYSESGTPLSQGSGVIIESSGKVVTNHHVISGASVIVVRRPKAEPVFASHVIATSEEWDLALLKIPGGNLPALTLASSRGAKVGTHVIAIGSPLGFENSISEGIIGGIRESLLQVTTPISPGSSGGALLSDSGEVLGLTTLIAQGGQNVNFAVPAEKITKLLSSVHAGTQERALGRLSSIPDPRAKGTSDANYYQAFREALKTSCSEIHDVDNAISQAISVGAPIYNAGSHIGCYRIYEGASYKLLYLLDTACPTVKMTLAAGLAQAERDTSDTDKAWTMRRTFDLIIGEPTQYK